MIIDAHYHFDERMEPLDRLLSQMAQHHIDKIALIAPMCDPFHVEGIAEKLANLGRKALMGNWKKVGLVMYNTTVTAKGKFSILGKTYDIYDRPDDELVASAIKAHPDKFLGWIFINPMMEDPIKYIDQHLGNTAWIGVKCHPHWHRYPVSMLDDAASYCEEKELPLLLHLGGIKDRGDFRYLPERHPKLKLVYAHAGVPHYGELWGYIQNKPNVYVDISSPYLDEALRNQAVKTLGAEKCIYGTDGPFGYPGIDGKYDHGIILSEIDRFPISGTDKEKILGENFSAITGI